MPDRIVRDELLDSDRYLGLSSDTVRIVFVHFLLVADDLGNAEATGPFIRRRILPGSQVPDDTLAKILEELSSVDLVRVYEVGPKRYVHIPRFRQRLRSFKRINPRPPSSMECAEIKEIADKLSDTRQALDGHMSGTSQSLAGEGRKGSEGRNRRKGAEPREAVDKSSGLKPFGDKSPGKSTHQPAKGWWKSDGGIVNAATALNIKTRAGETFSQLKDRIFAEISKRAETNG